MTPSSSNSTSVLPVPPGRRLPVSAAVFLRTTGIFGKDLIRHLGTFSALLLVALGAVYLPWLGSMIAGGGSPDWSKVHSAAPDIFFGMLTAAAYLFGLVISADEVEGRTGAFLDSLPVSRTRLLLSKLLAGAALLGVWVFAAGALMGLLSGRGGDLLAFLLQTPDDVHAILNYGRSFPITLLQCLSLLLTGLVAGTLFRHFAGGAVLGMTAYLIYTVAVSNLLDTPNKTGLESDTVTGGGLAVWCLLMAALYPAASRRLRNASPHGSPLPEGVNIRGSILAEKLTFLSRRGSFDPPHRHLLRAPLLLLAFPGSLVTWLVAANAIPPFTWVAVYSCLLAFFGAASWMPEERHGGRFFVYALPVSRSRLFWPRVRATLLSTLLLAILNTTALLIGLSGNTNRLRHLVQDPSSRTLLILSIAAVPILALLAQLFRLFFRGILIPAMLALVTAWTWFLITWLTLRTTLGLGDPGSSTLLSPAQSTVQILWDFTLLLGLPVAAGWLAFCRTRLLEQPERPRSSAGFVLFLLLLVWGGFLLGLSPAHLWILLVG